MSRVGKNPVEVPSGVEVSIAGNVIAAKGKLGALQYETTDDVTISLEDGKITVVPVDQSKKARSTALVTGHRFKGVTLSCSLGSATT